MTMAKPKDMISSEEARIMLLEQKNDDFYQALNRIEKRFEQIDARFDRIDEKFDRMDEKFNRIDEKFERMDEKFERMNNKIDSHFRTSVFMILGLYAGVVGTLVTAIGKAYHWF